MTVPEKLKNLYSQDMDHSAFMQLPKQRSYACECKKCNLTLYTSFKRLNCEYCGSSDPDVFECKELK